MAVALLAIAPPVFAQQLTGPVGMSRDKVLVIGLDGARWDTLMEVAAAGGAPTLKALIERGAGTPTMLPYSPPAAFTVSQVGWATIAAGVGPDKHGVTTATNDDPDQASKNGYPDFITRAERQQPQLSTFLVADWGNIARAESGGPIFAGADAVQATSAQSVAGYDRDDEQNATIAAQYLRGGEPDLGFVYLGVIDAVAHASGARSQAYSEAIVRTDARVTRMLDAIRARPTLGQEHWTVLVTTDHGQIDLPIGSDISHGGSSELERTSFVIAAGPGVPTVLTPDTARVTDIAPTVLHQLGLSVDPLWNLDGASFISEALPPDAFVTLHRSGALTITARIAPGARGLRVLDVTLPQGMTLARMGRDDTRLRALADGRAPRTVTTSRSRRKLEVTASEAGRLTLSIPGERLALTSALRSRLAHRQAVTLGVRMVEAGDQPRVTELRLSVAR